MTFPASDYRPRGAVGTVAARQLVARAQAEAAQPEPDDRLHADGKPDAAIDRLTA